MIIDAYAHMLNSQLFDWLADKGGKWAREKVDWGLAVCKRKPHFTDIALRVEQLDRNGIDLQVVTPPHTFDSNLLPGGITAQLAYARVLNDSMAKLTEDSKGRLIAAGTVPMAGFDQGSRQEMERAIKALGLKAIAVASNINGVPLDSPKFEPFWAQAAEMDVPIYIHPNDPAETTGRSYEAEYDLIHNFGWPYETVLMLSRLVFSGIMERYPTLKVVSHHLGGGMIPFYWGRILETYEPENQRDNYGGQVEVLPRPLFDYFSRFYYDTAVGGSAPAIRCAYEVFGADHIIFATDGPWGAGTGEFRLAEYPKVIESLGLSKEDTGKIFAGNTQRLLNLH